jgi:hypothetical protein
MLVMIDDQATSPWPLQGYGKVRGTLYSMQVNKHLLKAFTCTNGRVDCWVRTAISVAMYDMVVSGSG